MQPRAVGIDLGTTFSSVAVVDDDGQARAIPNTEGKLTTPSIAIWVQDHFIVGQQALAFVEAASGPEQTLLANGLIRGVKRMMGNAPLGGLISNGRTTTPVEISAAILNTLTRDASTHLGFQVQDAVITVPAHFADKERNATRKAAEMTGLRVLQMINEPSAAALTYTRGQQAEAGTALVFDLGGGTFDATVLQLGEKEARVLATQGIEELGGINFTNSLASELKRNYERQRGNVYPNDSVSHSLLVAAAEQAKCALSEVERTIVSLAPVQGQSEEIVVTRQRFENLIDLDLFKLQTAVELALDRAKKTPPEIQRVLLCGGSSRIPAVRTMLTDVFGRSPESVLDLDLSVALGAAYQARNHEIASGASQSPVGRAGLQMLAGSLIVDCVSYPVGIAVLDVRGENFIKLVMLRPGDSLNQWSAPYAVRIAGVATNFPPIAVYKGEGALLDSEDHLGDILIVLPTGAQQGSRATIKMQQDQSGLIQVQLTLDGRELPGSLRRVSVTAQ
jgi:molecular chaperone DnaK